MGFNPASEDRMENTNCIAATCHLLAYNCCVFWPAFETFLGFFLMIYVNFKFFQWFFGWNKKKRLKKQCFKLLFKAGWHANSGWLPKGGTPIMSVFNWFFIKNYPKRLKTPKKSILISLQVSAAPENWSKYTTYVIDGKKFLI